MYHKVLGQTSWLECWSIKPFLIPLEQHQRIFHELGKFGCINVVWPSQPEYHAALLCSAAYPCFIQRAMFLQSCIMNGVRVNQIFVMCGDRVLDRVGDGEGFNHFCTEMDVANHVMTNILASCRVPMTLVAGEGIRNNAGNVICRANMRDILSKLQNCHGGQFQTSQPVLAVASQPYIPAIEARLLSSWLGNRCEVVGPGIAARNLFCETAYPNWTCDFCAMALDSVAQWLNNFVQRRRVSDMRHELF